jgi:transcriptional regulator with XRE-family HTH domain
LLYLYCITIIEKLQHLFEIFFSKFVTLFQKVKFIFIIKGEITMKNLALRVGRMASFKERFLILKTEKNVTLDEIATEIQTNKASLSRIVNGVQSLKSDALDALSVYFNVDKAYLLGESDIRNKNIQDIIDNAYVSIAKSAAEKGISPERLKKIIDLL